ncbi:histidine phosphatase family protein [Butyrivibrio sp. WCD3002]|uniref:histidine phosphatase family protein n=1 Tax=Butyrivibrio sp. WCD3002 TaxID=1280676 RepID=UPI00040CC46E|nr:histidine phosphatase family protein [Butyrivibrio sp. WCD3002]
MYDAEPIKAGSCSVDYDGQRVYVSELDRSLETARLIFGDRDFYRTGLINEVPLRSAFNTKRRLPTLFWYMFGRLQWFWNSKRQPETRRETLRRASEFVRVISEFDEDIAIVTHGFFMHTLILQMKQVGYKPSKNKTLFRNGEVIVMENSKKVIRC